MITHARAKMCADICTYVYIYLHVCQNVCGHMHIRTCIHIYVYYICTHITYVKMCVDICTYVHMYTCTPLWFHLQWSPCPPPHGCTSPPASPPLTQRSWRRGSTDCSPVCGGRNGQCVLLRFDTFCLSPDTDTHFPMHSTPAIHRTHVHEHIQPLNIRTVYFKKSFSLKKSFFFKNCASSLFVVMLWN